MHEAEKFYDLRTNQFVDLVKNRSVATSSGRLAVDSSDATPSITDEFTDPSIVFGLDNPCPPTTARKDKYAASPASTAAKEPFTAASTYDKYAFAVAPHAIRNEEAKFLKSLQYVIYGAPCAAKLIDDAAGEGTKLLKAARSSARRTGVYMYSQIHTHGRRQGGRIARRLRRGVVSQRRRSDAKASRRPRACLWG